MYETNPKYRRIMLGEPVCRKIKEIYFADETWFSCYRRVGDKFTELKRIARKFYGDKDEALLLEELKKYSTKDIQDCFEGM